MTCILAALPAGACHWPLDDPGPGLMDRALFCAAPVPFEGCRYCARHMKAGHRPHEQTRTVRRMAQIRAALFRLKLKGGDMADTENVADSAVFPEPMPPHSREHLDELLTPKQTDNLSVGPADHNGDKLSPFSGLRPVAPIALGEIEAELIPTGPPTVEWMAPTDLLVDEAYQRSLSDKSKALIRKIAGHWDWRRFKPPIIAWTERGFEIVDGQHTAIAAACRGIEKIPVMVIEATEVQDRASAFIGQNKDRLAVSAMQLHHAAVVAGDDEAVTIEQVCARAGVHLIRSAFGGYKWKAGDTVAVDAIRKLVDTRGALTARKVLEVLVQAGCAPVTAAQIKAVDMLMTTAQYAEQLEPYPQNVTDLAQAVRTMGDGAEKEAKLFAKANCLPLWKALAATWFSKTKKRRKAA